MATARLLIVDDEPASLSAISRILKARYEVLSASSPRKALEIVKKSAPIDLVISDLEMPEMQGTRLLSQVSRLSPSTGCLLISGNADIVTKLPMGIPFLNKPFSARELYVAVEAVLAQSQILKDELGRKMEQAAALLERSGRLKRQLDQTKTESAKIRSKSCTIRGLSTYSSDPKESVITIICATCTTELPANTSICGQCKAPVGLHTIIRDGFNFGIAAQNTIKLHGLTLEKAQELVAILNSIKL